MQFKPTEKPDAAGADLHVVDARLQELERLNDNFASTIDRELRNPLTSIRALAEILLSEPDLDLELRQNFLQIVVDETERLNRLSDSLLDLANTESGRAA